VEFTSPLLEIISDHTAVTFPPLPQLKLVLDLATPEEFKAKLTWWWLYLKIVYLPKTVTYLRKKKL